MLSPLEWHVTSALMENYFTRLWTPEEKDYALFVFEFLKPCTVSDTWEVLSKCPSTEFHWLQQKPIKTCYLAPRLWLSYQNRSLLVPFQSWWTLDHFWPPRCCCLGLLSSPSLLPLARLEPEQPALVPATITITCVSCQQRPWPRARWAWPLENFQSLPVDGAFSGHFLKQHTAGRITLTCSRDICLDTDLSADQTVFPSIYLCNLDFCLPSLDLTSLEVAFPAEEGKEMSQGPCSTFLLFRGACDWKQGQWAQWDKHWVRILKN